MTKSKKFNFFDTAGISISLNENGYCIIKSPDDSLETFKNISRQFGPIQFHTKSDVHGVVGGGEPINKDWKSFKDDYHGELSNDFFPHTDGSFLNGMAYVDGIAKKITPPKFVILQCISKPENGGENFLVDGKNIYNDLLANNTAILKTLMASGSVNYCRDDLLSIDCSVFEKINNEKLRIRYRYDNTAFVPEWASAAFNYIQNKYTTNDNYITHISLGPGDILIVDNFRVLHARNKFSDGNKKRKVRRLWIADDSNVTFTNILNQLPVRRAMLPFQKYITAPYENAERLFVKYTCGIHYKSEKTHYRFKTNLT